MPAAGFADDGDGLGPVSGTHGVQGRERPVDHYLKGVVWCGRCERRLIIARAQGRHGGQYFYYFCRGRQERTCDLPYIVVERIEEAVLRHYCQVRIPAEVGDRLRTAMDQTVASGADNTRQLRAQYAKRLKELDAREDRYLDLVDDPDWPREKVSGRMRAIRDERASLKRQLDDTDGELQVGYQVVTDMLELLADPQELYRVAQKRTRAILNKAIFTKLFIDFEGEGPYVTADELTEPFETVVYLRREARGGVVMPGAGGEVEQVARESLTGSGDGGMPAAPEDPELAGEDGRDAVGSARLRRRFALTGGRWYERRDDSGVLLAEDAMIDDKVTVPGLLGHSLWGVGSSKTGMVEVRGLEPLASSVRGRRSTRLSYTPWSTCSLQQTGRMWWTAPAEQFLPRRGRCRGWLTLARPGYQRGQGRAGGRVRLAHQPGEEGCRGGGPQEPCLVAAPAVFPAAVEDGPEIRCVLAVEHHADAVRNMSVAHLDTGMRTIIRVRKGGGRMSGGPASG